MIAAEDWLGETTSALHKVAEAYFDLDTMEAVAFHEANSPWCGARIGLASEHNSVQLMMVATRPGAESLAKALLGFDADDAIETSDLADALGEIVNIVAGMVKTAVNAEDNALHLTLPTFLEGTLAPSGGEEILHTVIKIGAVQTKVVVINGAEQIKHAARSSAA